MKNERKLMGPGKIVLEETGFRTTQFNLYSESSSVYCKTLKELCVKWLQGCCATVKKSTYCGYSYCVNSHIIPFFGEILLEEIDGTIIAAFIDRMQKKNLAATTVHSVLAVFKLTLKYGARIKLLDSRLLDYCNISCHRPESKVLTLQESNRMKEYLLEENNIFAIAILLCRGTGIRLGELCGLKWEDIDFSTDTFRIRRTISRIANPHISENQPKTVIYIRPPKSNTSAREIPIPGYLIKPLKQLRKDAELYLLTGRLTCTEPRNVQKKFKTILKRCAMEDCNFHAMRHGFATACLEKGVDCKTVSSILGHASTRTTMEFYVHTSMRQKANCINSIE